MCTTNIYTYEYPDGHKTSSHETTPCSTATRNGQPCANNVVFQHPSQPVPYTDPVYASYANQFPPTPSYTPRSTTPNYRSGDESDRSYRSTSSGGKRRSSGVYVDGRKVLDFNRRDRHHAQRERIVIVDGPPTPRTPPQTFSAPHTAPPSPNANETAAAAAAAAPQVVEAAPRDSSRRRPVIVDERSKAERPRVKIEISRDRDSSKHSRHASASSRDSRDSRFSHSSLDEEDARRRHRDREERRRRQDEAEELRQQKVREQIAKANAEIANRPAVPLKRAATGTYMRPSVEVPQLVEAVRRITFEDARREEKARRLAEEEEKKEEEAQRQRLMERMMPRRRATVGPGSRRHRVSYDDGVYRYE